MISNVLRFQPLHDFVERFALTVRQHRRNHIRKIVDILVGQRAVFPALFGLFKNGSHNFIRILPFVLRRERRELSGDISRVPVILLPRLLSACRLPARDVAFIEVVKIFNKKSSVKIMV